MSLSNGVLPYKWKTTNVTLIHNKGPIEEPSNYRPILLTSIPCKLLEHIVLHYLNENLDTILYNRQLRATCHDIAKAMDRGSALHGVILDFLKAFDKVPHYLLMRKIQKMEGISHKITNWIRSVLTNRSQRVAVRGALSTKAAKIYRLEIRYETVHSIQCNIKPITMYLQKRYFEIIIYFNDFNNYINIFY